MSRNGIAGIDHIVLAVRELEAARMGWTRLGFTLSPRGTHLGRGTGNYCIMFAGDYIELLGIVGTEPASPEHARFLGDREGPMKLAWATADGEAAAVALRAIGLSPSLPRDLGRQLELPEATVVARFTLVELPADATPGLSSFLCEHRTPALMRRPEWLAHANGAIGLVGVSVVVDDTAPLHEAYERLFGAASIHTTDDILTVRIGRHRIVFASPDDFAAMHAEIEVEFDLAPPFIASLTLNVADLEATTDYLTTWQVAYESVGATSLLVPAAEANGAVLEFVAQR